MTLANSWICVILSVFLILIEVVVYYIKPDFSYAINDEENYVVRYQKWLRAVFFVFSAVMAVLCIYFAVNYQVKTGYAVVGLQTIITYCYILIRYKRIVVSDGRIHVYRFMRENLDIKFSDISKVNYVPNAKIQVVLKDKTVFDASFNSDNYNTFYNDLIKHGVKFKTGNIPYDQSYVYISKYNLTMFFPKNTFREYYQSKTYFRNSRYLFSARNLESKFYIEGFTRDTSHELDEFIGVVKNDLVVNGYSPKTVKDENFNDLMFTSIKAVNKEDAAEERAAFIYHGFDSYFVLYVTYLAESRDAVLKSIKAGTKKAIYEDTRSITTRV